MVPGGTTEIIWHFAGYLHLITEEVRARAEYDEAAFRALQNDYKGKLPSHQFPADLDELDTKGGRPPELPVEHQVIQGQIFPAKLADKLPPPKLVPPSKAALEKIIPSKGGGGGGGDTATNKTIKVFYGEGEGELQIQADQLNRMEDDDVFGVNPESGVADLNRADTAAEIEDMLETAQAQVPEEIALPQGDMAAVMDFIKARDDVTAASDAGDENAEDGENADAEGTSLEPGLYINGELQPADAARPEKPESEEVAPDPAAKGQWADLGDNTATNAALIVDLNEAAANLVVLGDFFQTNGIIQTNLFVDNDRVELGRQNPIELVTGGNTADNIAEFARNGGLHGQLAGNFAGMFWNVDVVDGDFIDINLFTQRNELQDNDITGQEAWDTHLQLVVGENGTYNLAQLSEALTQYDVIIIGGDYHGANLIFQTNILFDSDVLKMVAGGADPTAQYAYTGQNALLNDATIATYGNDVFQPLDPAMEELIAALASGQTNLSTAYGHLFAGDGGALNVLYITGDYYDINALWQINVVADADTALQLLAPPDRTGTGYTQQAETGGNELTNHAAIVDVGSTFASAGGDVYEDAILVQANLVTDDADSVVNKGTDALISEIIAFTDDDQASDTSETLPTTTSTQQTDVMGSVLN